MQLLEELIGSLRPAPEQVSDVVAGRYWTLVSASHSGVALRPHAPESHSDHGSVAPDDGQGARPDDLAGGFRAGPVEDLFEYALSSDPAKVSLGLAALNGVAAGRCDPRLFRPYRLPRARGKRVAVVGEFRFLDDLRSIAESIWVIRKNPESNNYDGTDAENLIPDADIAMIAASAIIDGTLEYLLDLARPCYTVVHGPSTPLSPLLFGYGADQLVGVMIKDREVTKRYISQGGRLLTDCQGIQPMVLIRQA